MADENGFYIMLLSIHGLIRGQDMELGRDPDTGGQVKYVVELARALGKHKDVSRVDLVTRQIFSSNVSETYAAPVEPLGKDAQIIRIPCGPKRYFRKEVLWPYLDEFTDNTLRYLRSVGRVPDVVHGHYADAGLVASHLSQLLATPMVFTGHSLGHIKKERMRLEGMSPSTIEKKYNIGQRIEAEEVSLANALMVITSTGQERDEQYCSYENYHPERMHVLPPGVDLSRFSPLRRGIEQSRAAAILSRFYEHPKRPLVLALSRADAKKNIPTLVRAYAETPGLADVANLAIVAGNRDDITKLPSGPSGVLKQLLLDVDRYDLYGKVAYPKHHEADDVPDFYRLAASRKGVFVNPALTEPFGLTLLEAAASGLPVVATNDGGPGTIISRCSNGLLVDPTDSVQMGRTILSLLRDEKKWNDFSRQGIAGVRKAYSWDSHVASYVKGVKRLGRVKGAPIKLGKKTKIPTAERLVITDIDNTLLGDRDSLARLLERLKQSDGRVGFGVATGRHLESTLEVLWEWGVPLPDVMICAVGSEIYYGTSCCRPDETWRKHIDYRWNPEAIDAVMEGVEGVTPQPPKNRGPYKCSYYYDQSKFKGFRELRKRLRNANVHVKMIHSHGEYLDLLPLRASKGHAIRHLCLRWGMPLEQVLVAGDSGNDKDMLSGSTRGVVVGNYSKELRHLREGDSLYFAQGRYAQGILEGMDHYGF